MNIKQIFKQQLRRKVRNFVDNVDVYTNMSKRSVGFLIRTFHATLPMMTLIVCAMAPRLICVANIVWISIMSMMFFVFDGCLLTKLECELCGDNFTIIDPVLELLYIDVTAPNRTFMTRIGFLVYVIMLPLIYYLRFFVGGSMTNNMSATLNFGITI
jgi:hypothetical protein